MLRKITILGICVQLSEVITLKGTAHIWTSTFCNVCLKNSSLLYNHASILDIFMNIRHNMDPMRDMILKIREINIQEISRRHVGSGTSPAAQGVVSKAASPPGL